MTPVAAGISTITTRPIRPTSADTQAALTILYQRRQGSHQQRGFLRPAPGHGGVLGEHLAHVAGNAIAEEAAVLLRLYGWPGRLVGTVRGYRRTWRKELDEMPAGLVADQQVLRLPPTRVTPSGS